ncbi:MAG: putative internalin, partial [Frankiales bacterium]|nr:putative internalin [Frankiales bacterium]
AVLLDWAACTSPWTAALGDAEDGAYGLQVRAVDKAGNTSAPLGSEYVLDHTAGALAGFTDLPPAVARDDTPTWGLEVEPGQTLQCRLSGPDAVGAFAACGTPPPRGAAAVAAGTYTAPLTGRPDGAYVVELRALSTTGTPGPASRATYVLDRTPPRAARLTAEPDAVGNEDSVTWAWDADPQALVDCRLLHDGAPRAGSSGTWAPCRGQYPLDLDGAPQGTYTLQVRTRDEAGNLGDVTSGSYRYDTVPPAPVSFVGDPVLAPGGRTLTWTFAQAGDARAQCTVVRDGQAVAPAQDCSRTFSVLLSGPGTYELSVAVHDDAGNPGLVVARDSYDVLAAAEPVRVVDDRPLPPVPGGSAGAGPGAGPVTAPSVPVVPSSPGAAPAVVDGGTAPFGPPLPGGVGVPAPTGPQLVDVARTTPVVGPGREEADLPGPVQGLVDTVKRALPDRITLPSAAEVPQAIGRVFGDTFKKAARQPTLPLAVVFVVVAFLLVQNRIDRRDPKLASAPVEAEPELTFGPVLRLPRQDGPGHGGPAGGVLA